MSSPRRLKPASNAGSNSRRGDQMRPDPILSTFTHNRGVSSEMDNNIASPPIMRVDESRQQQSRPLSSRRTRGSSDPHLRDDAERRDSLVSSVMTNTMSTRPSKSSLVKRKSSGLKTTLKRVFGSKRSRPSLADGQREFDFSDPGNLMATAATNATHHSNHPVRPVTRSSGYGPSDKSPTFRERVVGMAESGTVPTVHRRRNTLPSLVFSDNEAQNFSKSLGNYIGGQCLDDAVMSNPSATNLQKRCRSDEALMQQQRKNTTASNTSLRQDRAAEIAYWRNSVLLDPVVSTKASSTFKSVPSDSEKSQSHTGLPQALKPVQSFDFGLSCAPGATDLEERVNTLEVKMFDFEYAIAKLQGVELSKPVLAQPMATRKSSRDLYAKSSEQSLSSTSSGQHFTFLDSPAQSTFLVEHVEPVDVPGRTSNVETIRPRTSPRVSEGPRTPSSVSMRMTHGQFESLKALIQDERAARQHMEMQIMDLQKEIQLLQAPIYADIRPLDQSVSNTMPFGAPLKTKRLHRTPPIKFQQPSSNNFSRFSADSDAGSESGYEEMYQTPREDRRLWEHFTETPRYAVPVV